MRISRRTFTSAAISASFLRATTPPGKQESQGGQVLPPSIQALRSMQSSGRPISRDEQEQRCERARTLMRSANLDAILLAGGSSLRYFTGVHWGNSERLFAFLLPVHGKAACVCPSFEEARAREQLGKGPFGTGTVDVLTWHENDDPYALLAGNLKDRGSASASIGIEERVPFVFSNGLAAAAPNLTLKSATAVTSGCRGIKSAHELELMTVANQATLAVYKAVYGALQPGMTQDHASALITAAYERVGFGGEASVQVGKYTALPHGSVTPQVIEDGAIVMIDDGCTVEGYNSDITRTFVLGKPTDKMRRVFDLVHRAQATACQTAKPGNPCEAVDAAARKVIADGGFGPQYQFFSHRLGHGIGLDGHEWPYLVGGNYLPLAPNMTFSDEPGIYIPGEFGIRLEDDMYVTEEGARLFTEPSPSLEHPFG